MVHVRLAYPPCLNFIFNFSAFFVITVALGKWGSHHIILYMYMYDAKFMSCLPEIHADTMRGRVAEWLVCWIQDKECQVWTLIRGHCITMYKYVLIPVHYQAYVLSHISSLNSLKTRLYSWYYCSVDSWENHQTEKFSIIHTWFKKRTIFNSFTCTCRSLYNCSIIHVLQRFVQLHIKFSMLYLLQ